MIDVQGLTKRYGDLTAIDQVSFQVNKGEVLAFLGPNGAGKTTTMRILTGFMPATSGTATVGGCDIFTQNREVKKKIGYLPESPPVYTDLTVGEYLRFVAGIKEVPRGKVRGAVDRALEQ
ncbi:MAG TPA: ABC transporter ATP-binding protein, partial [Nitrospiria bacterium]